MTLQELQAARIDLLAEQVHSLHMAVWSLTEVVRALAEFHGIKLQPISKPTDDPIAAIKNAWSR